MNLRDKDLFRNRSTIIHISSDTGSGVTGRDYKIAVGIGVCSLLFFYLQLSGLPDTVRQFTKYPVAAAKFLDGTLAGERLFDFSPLYLFLCTMISKLTADISQPLLLVQITMASLACGVLFLLLRRHFGLMPSLLGSAAFMLNRSLLIYSYYFEPEITLVLLLLLFLYFVEQKGVWNALLTGILLVLCLLTRPSFLFMLLLVPFYYWLRGGKEQLLRRSALFLCPFLALLLTFTVSTGRFTPPPLMNPGTVFYDANNPQSKGVTAEYPPTVFGLGMNFPDESDYQHALYRLVARRTTGRELSQGEVNRLWASRARQYINDYPGIFAVFEMRKLYHIFHGHRWHDIGEAYVLDAELQKNRLPVIPFAFVSSCALLGFWCVRRRWREFFLIGIATLSQISLILVTYASDRQRLSLVPLFIVFAVAAISCRSRKLSRLIPAVLFLIVCLTVFARETGAMPEDRIHALNYNKGFQFHEKALVLQRAGDLKGAAVAQARAIALSQEYGNAGTRMTYLPTGPGGAVGDALLEFDRLRGDDPCAAMDRAVLSLDAGDLTGAERLLLALQKEGSGEPAEVLYHLGRIAVKRSRKDDARHYFMEVLALKPGKPRALAQMAVLDGEKTYIRQLERYFGEPDALYFLGSAYMEHGRYGDAASCFAKVGRYLPEYWPARVALAAALSGAGQYRAAADAYLAAMEQFSAVVTYPEKIVPAFKYLSESSAANSLDRYLYGRVLFQTGDFNEARRVLQSSLQASGRQSVADELQRLEKAMGSLGML